MVLYGESIDWRLMGIFVRIFGCAVLKQTPEIFATMNWK